MFKINEKSDRPWHLPDVWLMYGYQASVDHHLYSTQVEVVEQHGDVVVQPLGGTEVELESPGTHILHLVL